MKISHCFVNFVWSNLIHSYCVHCLAINFVHCGWLPHSAHKRVTKISLTRSVNKYDRLAYNWSTILRTVFTHHCIQIWSRSYLTDQPRCLQRSFRNYSTWLVLLLKGIIDIWKLHRQNGNKVTIVLHDVLKYLFSIKVIVKLEKRLQIFGKVPSSSFWIPCSINNKSLKVFPFSVVYAQEISDSKSE